jgi:hypothetical protein
MGVAARHTQKLHCRETSAFGSDLCQIHVWETFSKIVVGCILIPSRRRRPSLPLVQA